ncbi:MAG: AIR carboxylase family protein [Nanoarchaeota archaeon]|nr:AIR carboxylase family protein [Nanoarchaeota archaeon]
MGDRISFEEGLQQKLGCAIIVAGSGSDKSHIEKIVDSLKEYTVPFDVRVCSVHKQLEQTRDIVEYLVSIDAPLAIVAVAGGTDGLSGTLAYQVFNHPTISCPPDGIDNRSVLTNPPGSSNSTIYKPRNVGRYVAQMFAHLNLEYARILLEKNEEKDASLGRDDREIQDWAKGIK